MKIQWLGIILLLISVPFSSAEDVESYYDDEPYNWEAAEPENYGFDTSTMSSTTVGLSRHRSVLVVRDAKEPAVQRAREQSRYLSTQHQPL